MGLFGTPQGERFTGFFASPVTPFTTDLALDVDTFERLVDFGIRNGAHAVCAVMHMGESLNLTLDERKRLAEAAARAAAGRIPVCVNVSCPGTDMTVELARHAASAGAAAVLVVTPYHWRPSDDALLAHYTAVAQAVDIDVIGYSFPERLGVEISPELAVRLIHRLPNFAGLKDAKYNFQTFTEMCRVTAQARPGFSVFTGIEYMLPSMVVGGAGSFAVLGTIAPNAVRELFQACIEQRYDDALPLQQRLSQLWFLLRHGYPARLKAALALMGRPVGEPRLPILAVSDADLEWLRPRLEALVEGEPRGWDVPVPKLAAAGARAERT